MTKPQRLVFEQLRTKAIPDTDPRHEQAPFEMQTITHPEVFTHKS